jgi:TetR/AcrR family transcriptional regulator, transcriptional repressor for nem operon
VLSKRDVLLRVGVEVFTEKGFHNTTVDELTAAAGVPKGSFTYYFGSKEAYTLAVIEAYGDYFNRKLDRVLQDQSVLPIDRIQQFVHQASLGMQRFDFRRGCIVGNLGQELGALDDRFRTAVLTTLRGWQHRIRQCLDEAVELGHLRQEADTEMLSKVFWYAWEGAVLSAKLEKSGAPLELVGELFLHHVKAYARPENNIGKEISGTAIASGSVD